MKKSKVLLISIALASLAAVRCTPSQKTKLDATVAEANVVVAACDLEFPPAPPPAFWMSQEGCFGSIICTDENEAAIAQWVVDLAKWTKEAQECIWAVKDVIK